MDGNVNGNSLVGEQDDDDYSPENSGDSPRSNMFNDNKMTSTSSPKGSRRGMQKRVVSVPIKDVEGSRAKGEMTAPPSDSWAWRKYGQKPIKGSPYPRGYYRCSSSKGCPARKQVERSRVDPNMIIITYSCEHNHPWPASRNHHRTSAAAAAAATSTSTSTSNATSAVHDVNDANPISDSPVSNSETKYPTGFTDQSDEEKFAANLREFGWFEADFESPPPPSPSSTMLESPISAEDRISDADTAMIFSMREEDESLFADLGELPECSVVFRRREVIARECTLTRWCGTTR